MNTPLIFWDVDTQLDFLSPQGKLYVAGAETILPNLERLTRWAADHRVLIVASACAHHSDDTEFRDWPPHCLAGTEGQRKVPETVLPHHCVLPNRSVPLPEDLPTYQQIVIEKQALDVFTNPNAENLLALLRPQVVVLYGVVTEFCVSLAARHLLERGLAVRLVQDAVASIDEGKARSFLDEFRTRGGVLTTTEAVVSRNS